MEVESAQSCTTEYNFQSWASPPHCYTAVVEHEVVPSAPLHAGKVTSPPRHLRSRYLSWLLLIVLWDLDYYSFRFLISSIVPFIDACENDFGYGFFLSEKKEKIEKNCCRERKSKLGNERWEERVQWFCIAWTFFPLTFSIAMGHL